MIEQIKTIIELCSIYIRIIEEGISVKKLLKIILNKQEDCEPR